MTPQQHYPFTLMPLPYGYDALSPYVSEETLHFHHDKHHQAYVDNLNRLLEPHANLHDWTLEELLCRNHSLPQAIRTGVANNAGGVYNHNQLWLSMTGQPVEPHGQVFQAILGQYGTLDAFQKEFIQAGVARFGSGWSYLALDKRAGLVIGSLANQETVMDHGLCLLMLFDVWEHAYYLDYQNRRPDYLAAMWNVVNWDYMEQRYQACLADCQP